MIVSDAMFDIYLPVYLRVSGFSSKQSAERLAVPSIFAAVLGCGLAAFLGYRTFKSNKMDEGKKTRYIVVYSVFFSLVMGVSTMAIPPSFDRLSLWFILVFYFFFKFAINGWEVVTTQIINEIVDKAGQKAAFGVMMGVRTLSASLAITASGAIYQNFIQQNLSETGLDPDEIAAIRESLNALPANIKGPIFDAFVRTIKWIFWVGGAAGVLTFLFAVLHFYFYDKFEPRHSSASSTRSGQSACTIPGERPGRDDRPRPTEGPRTASEEPLLRVPQSMDPQT